MMSRSRDIDGGWAWVVLIAAFINLLIGPGLAFVGGMFQIVFLDHFHESVALTSWVTALFASLLQLAGPASSMVATYFSCRTSVMVGAVLLAVGLFVSSFVNTIQLLLVFMGIVAGVGLGLTYSASVVIVNMYFVKMRIFVTGVALSATGAGCLALPLLCRHLLDVFSWRETLSILAGLSLQMAICGSLMFPLHEQESRTMCCRDRQSRNTNSRCIKDTETVYDVPDVTSQEEVKMLNQEIVIDKETEENSLIEYKDDNQMSESNNLISTGDLKNDIGNTTTSELTNSEEDKSVFTNIGFLLLCFHLFLSNSACGIFLIHFPSFAQTFSVSQSDVAFAMSMNGPALTISRVLLGALGNDDKIDPLSVYIGTLLTGGLIILVTPVFATTPVTQTATMALIGFYFGGSYSFLTALTIDCVGLKKLTTAFGWEMICAGSGYLVAPPIAGWIVDKTGYYSNGIYLSGGFLYVSVFVVLLVPVFRGRPRPNPLHHPQDKTILVNSREDCNNIHKLENDT